MRSYEDMSNKTNKQNYTRDELIALFKTIKVTITEDERTELIEQLQEIIKLGEENKLIVLSNVVCSKCGEEECMEDTDHSSFGGKISNDPLSYAKENLDIYTIDDANNIICNDCMDDLLEDAYENFYMVKKEEDFDYTEILERIGELRKTKTEEEILLMLK
jgi:predicted Zn-ribbon and HTH transcriptional regulator